MLSRRVTICQHINLFPVPVVLERSIVFVILAATLGWLIRRLLPQSLRINRLASIVSSTIGHGRLRAMRASGSRLPGPNALHLRLWPGRGRIHVGSPGLVEPAVRSGGDPVPLPLLVSEDSFLK